jgi:probable phosphoglycerate mutase
VTALALLRHAETEWSAEKRLQGQTDVPLGTAGRRALSDCAIPDEWSAMQVVSSPLARCLESAECLRVVNLRIEPRLTEMSWGEWEGRSLSELREELGDSMRANEARGLDFQPPRGESPRLVWTRIQPWLAEIARQGAPTLAISHRGVVRVVFAAATGWDMIGRPPAKLDWSCMHLFELEPGGNPAVLRLNVPLAPHPSLCAMPVP